MTTEIKIPFGKEIYIQRIRPIIKANKHLEDKAIIRKIQAELTDMVVETLEAEGYNEQAIGRMFFEEALDWYVKITMTGILAKYLKLHKVPKFFPLKIEHGDYED